MNSVRKFRGDIRLRRLDLTIGWLALFAMLACAQGVVWGAAIAPCSAASGVTNILPVKDSLGKMTYCVSDAGWSDSWFQGTPTNYNGSIDILSGDDAPNLRWTSGPNNAGNGWMTPAFDQGTLIPQTSGGPTWTVVTAAQYIGAGNSHVQSVIRRGTTTNGLQVTIDTVVSNLSVSLTFGIRNLSATTSYTDVRLSDYFNLHPNGSCDIATFGSCTAQNNAGNSGVNDPTLRRNQGITSYANGVITTVGNTSRSDFLFNGRMWGSDVNGNLIMPTNHDVGFASRLSNTGASTVGNRVFEHVAANTWNNANGPTARWDTAGALQWSLGNIAPGQTVTFVIHKELTEVPEPGAWSLVLLGLGMLAYRRRSRALPDERQS